MIYPKFIKEDSFLGVTAPSDGITNDLKLRRLNNAKDKINQLGYQTIETENVRTSINGRSASSETRAQELEKLFIDEKVDAIICATGGEFLVEMLSKLNFNIIKDNPKWIQGYSDPTSLLYIITTMLDIATIYSNNFASFGMEKWHKSLKNDLEILKGNIVKQENFEKYEDCSLPYETGLEGFNLDEFVEWKNLYNEESLSFSGRIIGGCIDCLIGLVGTRFDYTKQFIDKYKQDGIIWYFDNCELTSEGIIRALWLLKENGWFNNCNGIVFGRSATNSSCYNIRFEEALKQALEGLNIPVIWDADIGHKSPQFTIINGSYAKFECENGKGSLIQELK